MSSISIILCCYNSAERLPETLRHLALQKLEKTSGCEILVVDNNCSDKTVEVAKNEWEKLGAPFPLTIVEEKKPGLSHARKKGVFAAKNDYICFCDDDNWLCENYLQTAIEIMDANESIGVLAGQGIAVSDIEIPNWFYTYYESFACGVLALSSGDVTYRSWVWGAGMVLRRAVLSGFYEAGFEHLTLGREGKNFSSGDDNEICYWHLLAGFKLWYEEQLVFKHYMSQGRLTKDYAAALIKGIKESTPKTKSYRRILMMRGKKKNLKGFLRAIIHAVTGNKTSYYLPMYLPWLNYEEKKSISDIQRNLSIFRTKNIQINQQEN